MSTPYHAIYLSPHLDDAVLSCGAQIARVCRDGKRVLIATVMAGDPPLDALSEYAHSLHTRWELAADAAAQRRAEDQAAARILGADTLHWSVPDCIYRTDPANGQPMYVSDDDIFGPIHGAEAGLVDRIVEKMGQLPPGERIYVPLCVGHHVDHQLVRAAAEAHFGRDVLYYEDYPYAQEEGTVEQIIGAAPDAWQPVVTAVDGPALTAKIEAILAFRSQLSTFFTDRADLERQVRGYAERVGGERLWCMTR